MAKTTTFIQQNPASIINPKKQLIEHPVALVDSLRCKRFSQANTVHKYF